MEVMNQAQEVAHHVQGLAAEATELREWVNPSTEVGYRVHRLLQEIEALGIAAARYL